MNAVSIEPYAMIGARIRTPYGVTEVQRLDLFDLRVTTDLGTWGFDEVFPSTAPPPTSDVELLEDWMTIELEVRARSTVEVKSERCGCPCGYCYRTTTWQSGRVGWRTARVGTQHFVDNEVCRCEGESCC